MKLLVSWSSGKDSAWMVHVLRQQSTPPAALLTTMNESVGRVAMHAVRRNVLRAQASALDLPLREVALPWPCTNEDYETIMRREVERAVAERFTHIAFGDLFLEDVRRYREERLAGTGLEPIFPLFGSDTTLLSADMTTAGLRARLTCVDPRVLSSSFAGRDYDRTLLSELPPHVDPCGERGEFHTVAYGGPMFAQPLALAAGDIVERDGFVFADFDLTSTS